MRLLLEDEAPSPKEKERTGGASARSKKDKFELRRWEVNPFSSPFNPFSERTRVAKSERGERQAIACFTTTKGPQEKVSPILILL